MPHDGSACATALKPLIDSANQNECCSATARSNCACTAGLHEVGKLTLPRRSGACAPARRVEAPSQAPRITIPVPTASVRVLTMTTSVRRAYHSRACGAHKGGRAPPATADAAERRGGGGPRDPRFWGSAGPRAIHGAPVQAPPVLALR